MPRSEEGQEVRQTALYLQELLRTRYRHRWISEVQRGAASDLHQLAVAAVLASYLQRWPEHPDDRTGDARRCKNVVSRLVTKSHLSEKSLELFIKAFSIDQADAETLRRIWRGDQPGLVVRGELEKSTSDPLRYQTVRLQEFHYLGADGLPERHRTCQVIWALVDDFRSHKYRFDTNELQVDRIHGGTPGKPYQLQGSIWAVDIALPQPLAADRTAVLEYETSFRYTAAVEPNFRRATHQRMENVLIRVEFHPARLPVRVWWAEWAHYREGQDAVLYREEVELDAENSIHRMLEVAERCVVGFLWEF